MKQEYKKYEFCKAVSCIHIINSDRCHMKEWDCPWTAKEFHKWLKDKSFKIVKETPDDHV